MKRISTLLLFIILFSTAIAQTDAEREEAKRMILGERKGAAYPKSGNDRDVILGRDNRTVYGGTNRRYPKRYPTTYGTSRERRLYEINREYDAKIYSIPWNRTLSSYEKDRIIRQLESERRRKLDQLNDSYYGKDSRYNNDDCNDNKKYKKKTGNHYGWRNGKHNPHNGK